MSWKIPLSDIAFDEREYNAVLDVLKSGWLTMGAVTEQFEQEFAAYSGAKHAIAVANATAALHLSCAVAGVESGDEVVVPSLSFVATANAVRYMGATPVFADIESDSALNISARSIAEKISTRTCAIIVMHYGGYACDMPAIMALAKEHDLVVIEDAAHAIGSSLNGKMLGTWGQTGCFSFFSNKNMTTGEGGMIVTDDDEIAAHLRILRSHGMSSLTWDRHKGHSWSYRIENLGYNYRLDEMRSALGRVQLAKLDGYNKRRRELSSLYRESLAELVPMVVAPFETHAGLSAAHIFPVLLPAGVDRGAFMDGMKVQGIQTSIHYPPIHLFEAFQTYNIDRTPLVETENVAIREVTLPLFPTMSDDDVLFVTRSMQTILLGE